MTRVLPLRATCDTASAWPTPTISNPAGSIIQFDPNVFDTPQTIALVGTGLTLGNPFDPTTIEGPESPLTISGGGPSSDFSVITVNPNVTASLSGLTIADGYSFVGGGIQNAGALTLTDSTLTGNSASDGGGLVNSGMATLTDVTIAGNAAIYGGGIGNHATLTLDDVTIAGNTANEGGGGIAVGGPATLNNSIVADNTGGDISYGIVAGAYDLIGNFTNSGGLADGSAGDIVGVDPLLAPLGSYGGPTQTMALLPGSPAIDAGSNALIPPGTSTDQRGFGRVVNDTVDIGAFESSGFTLAVAAGNNQSAAPGAAFADALEVSVTPNRSGEPVERGVGDVRGPDERGLGDAQPVRPGDDRRGSRHGLGDGQRDDRRPVPDHGLDGGGLAGGDLAGQCPPEPPTERHRGHHAVRLGAPR